MARICYKEKNFSAASREVVETANAIIAEYAEQGFDLTVRQLYYQFVARDLLENTERSYKRLGTIVNDARLAGLIDWEAVVDRTRFIREPNYWENPAAIIRSAAKSYNIDRWANQQYRPEVWIEKDALVGVIENVCNRHDVPYFSCRGYVSQSEMWTAARRMLDHEDNEQTAVIFHLGDHDPSGVDMSRDILDRLTLFGASPEFHRLALNENQVEQYNPPPNPAKVTDSRAVAYIAQYGDDSWELDALEPVVMAQLIQGRVNALIDEPKWLADTRRLKAERKALRKAAAKWPEVETFLTEYE